MRDYDSESISGVMYQLLIYSFGAGVVGFWWGNYYLIDSIFLFALLFIIDSARALRKNALTDDERTRMKMNIEPLSDVEKERRKSYKIALTAMIISCIIATVSVVVLKLHIVQ
jgi:hypothetical protein